MFDGWVPAEVHTHYDAEHNVTGYTTVERESVWTDETRARATLLVDSEDLICPCGCGLRVDVAHTKAPFDVAEVVCYAGRAVRQAERLRRSRAKADGEPDGWDDGLFFVARPHSPDKR